MWKKYTLLGDITECTASLYQILFLLKKCILPFVLHSSLWKSIFTSLHFFPPSLIFLYFWCLIEFLWWVWQRALICFHHFALFSCNCLPPKNTGGLLYYAFCPYALKFSKYVQNDNPYSLGRTRVPILGTSRGGRTWVPWHRFCHKGPSYLPMVRLIQFSPAVILFSTLSGLKLFKLASLSHISKLASVPAYPSFCQNFPATYLIFTDTFVIAFVKN